jgi:hypothetical protein
MSDELDLTLCELVSAGEVTVIYDPQVRDTIYMLKAEPRPPAIDANNAFLFN